MKRNSPLWRTSAVLGIGLSLAGLAVSCASASAPKPAPAAAADTAANPNLIPDDAAFFAMLDLSRPDLAQVKAAVDAKDWPAAKHAWAIHFSTRKSPHWLWSPQDKAEIVRIEDAQFGGLKRFVPAADRDMNRDFDFNGVEKHLDHDVNWLQGANEWTNVLSRFGYFDEMGRAYWATGDSKYAKDFVYLMERWIAKNPVPADSHKWWGTFGQTWRTLETGIRPAAWFGAAQFFMDAPEFDDEAKYEMTRSLAEHARYLNQYSDAYRSGNWQVDEARGLAELGIMLPEFKESAQWRANGFHWLVEHMQKDVEPDGMGWEMTPGYHAWVMAQYVEIAQLCRLNGYTVPGLLDRHEKMYEALMKLSKPNRMIPGVGDAHDMQVRSSMAEGSFLYHRPDMRYLATDSAPESWIWMYGPASRDRYLTLTKKKPDFTSVDLPVSQYVMMRTGWEPQDNYLLFDCAPWHGGHNHRDSLQVLAYAGGRDLLIDPGQASYDSQIAKTYLTKGIAHNIVIIDGKEQPPADADLLCWQTTKDADFASGKLAENGVVHQRSVLFVKPGYWVVVDRVTSANPGEQHELTRLFHLPKVAAHVDNTGGQSDFPEGTNIRLVPVDDPSAQTRIEMRDGYIPGPRNTPITTPVIAFVSKGALPMTLCTVLTPFTDAKALPTVTRTAPGGDPSIVRLHVAFPDGQSDDIAIADTPKTLDGAGTSTPVRALLVRKGPQSHAKVALGSRDAH